MNTTRILLAVGLVAALVSVTLGQAGAALNNDDIVKMVKAGLSPAIIVSTIKTQPTAFTLASGDMIALKTSGVPDDIIAAMIEGNTKGARLSAGSALDATVVPDGTEVKLRLLKPISSATARVEDRVEFEATADIVVNGVTLVQKNAAATGKVTEATPKKSFGRQGKLNFTIDAVKAVDGQNIRLRSTREAKGGESYGKAGVVTILAGPFGALVRGKDIEIPAGTEYTIYIDGDRSIKLKQGALPTN